MADANGEYINTKSQRGNIADQDYFQAVMTGKTVITEPLINPVTGKEVVVVAAPIKDGEGKVSGLLGATITLEELTNIISQTELGKTATPLPWPPTAPSWPTGTGICCCGTII